MVRVSVIIPTYRPGKYIWDCVDSLCRQTLDKSAFEVIIVLNGCNEPYLTMLEDGMASRPMLQSKLIHIEQGGVSNARNRAIDEARGEYICFLDDDDWLSETYLESLLGIVGDGIIAVSNVSDYDEATGKQRGGYISKAFQRIGAGSRVTLNKGRSFMSSSCCKMIPRDIIGNHRYDTRFRLGEDALFMASLSSGVHDIVLSNKEAIYYRRLRTTSASRKEETRWNKTKYALRLSAAYTKMYFSDVRRNDFLFFFSRIAASMHKIVKRSWI